MNDVEEFDGNVVVICMDVFVDKVVEEFFLGW